MLECARELLAILNAEGVILQANPGFSRLLGLDAEELIGKELAEFMHPDDAAELRSHLRKLAGLAGARCNVVFHKNANLQAAINVGRLACGLIVGYERDHGDEQRERKEPKRTNMHFVFLLR